MCGIAGIIEAGNPAVGDDVEKMVDALSHRGPDGRGLQVGDGWALGHSRLSIIDHATGQQPMSAENGQLWITFNGEIYNYRELRSELEALGRTFRTQSDTEVILEAYAQWGAEGVRKLRGMFAFGIVDLVNETLFLARDPVGIKPLVLFQRQGRIAFASEIKALRSLPAGPDRAKSSALLQVLRFGYVPGQETVFEDVVRVPPAHHCTIPLKGGVPKFERYWQWAPGRASDGDPASLLERLDDTVRAHLVADVDFGVFLSGGIDSSLIAWRMAELLEGPVTAFTIGFEDPEVDELQHAQVVAADLGIQLEHQTLCWDNFEKVPEILALYDEPFADSSAIPTWFVSKMARERYPMVLSGDGGDELFGGYRRYDWWMDRCAHHQKTLRHWKRRKPLRAFRRMGWDLRQQLSGNWARFEECLEFASQGDEKALRPFLRISGEEIRGHSLDGWKDAHRVSRGAKGLDYIQAMDFHVYLPDCILTKVDIASMAHGLEVRPPMLDCCFADYAASLPAACRYNAALPPAERGKIPLKELLYSRIAVQKLQRPKQGFTIPARWGFQKGGFLREMLEDLLHSPNHPVGELLATGPCTTLLAQHEKEGDRGSLLWTLLCLALWRERNPHVTLSHD